MVSQHVFVSNEPVLLPVLFWFGSALFLKVYIYFLYFWMKPVEAENPMFLREQTYDNQTPEFAADPNIAQALKNALWPCMFFYLFAVLVLNKNKFQIGSGNPQT